MTALRSLLFNLFFFIWTAGFLMSLWVLLPFPWRALYGAVGFWARSVRFVLRWVVGLDCEIRGRHHIPPGPAVFASKHQSAWETMAFLWLVDSPVYVLKKELMAIPFWGWYARKCGQVAVDRSAGAKALKDMVRGCRRALKSGRSVVIFPQGTRTAPGHERPYHPGVAALYAQCPAPVVPVALNSGLFWPRRNFRKYPGRIVLEFLPPLPPNLDRRQVMAELESRVESASANLAKEASQHFPKSSVGQEAANRQRQA